MDKQITLWNDGRVWYATSTDPVVRELFGTDTLPTPWLAAADGLEVMERIQGLNPGVRVVLKQEPRARACRRGAHGPGWLRPGLLAGGEGMTYHVQLRKHGSIWSWYTENPQGGGFGSSCGSGLPRGAALRCALRGVPLGATYTLTVNAGQTITLKRIDQTEPQEGSE